MKKELWIAGYPSFVGGADTELLHLITLLRMNDVDVNLVPMGGVNDKVKADMTALGCKTHNYNPTVFKGKVVASFCNGVFLEQLPLIMEHGRPHSVIWFNCMTWTFPAEVEAHKNDWIDYFGFVSNYQREILKPQLEKIKPIQELEGYRPYFDIDNKSQAIRFDYRVPTDHFALGRISRDDSGKFSRDMWNIFHRVTSPKPKKVFVLGFGKQAQSKCGSPPAGMDFMYWVPGAVSINEVYNRLHCFVHKTGGSRESYGRTFIESLAFGVPFICENNYAYPELIGERNGQVAWMCGSSDEMSYRASELAFDEAKRKAMIFAAHDFLRNEIANPDRCWRPWELLFKSLYANPKIITK